MIVELMACNAAFAVIKETINNGQDLMNAGQSLFDYFDNKSALAKKANEKGGSNRSDLEEFMALEQLKKQELELREMMQWQGRAGMWDDWLAFQVKAKKKREEDERQKVLRKQRIIGRIKDGFMILLIVVLLGGIGAIIGFAIWMARDV
jgi:flagellar biosynthesis protein FliP